ncbi:MAG: hypothetical protein ABIT08_05260 [Bacteroidia bacterium]
MKSEKTKNTMKNNAQMKHNKRKKQGRKNKMVNTNTTSIKSFTHPKYFMLQLAMLSRIIQLLFSDQWRALKDSLPGFKDACDKLQILVNTLNQKLSAYKKIIKDVAQEKKLARQALAEAGYRLMNSCRSYAVKNGLTGLAIKMDVNLSGLLHMKYKDLIILMNNSSALIQPLIPQPGFNITQEIYDDLQTKISDAESLENGPKSAINQRKSIGNELLIDMKSTMEFFDNEFVPLATNFRSNNAFWFQFVNDKHIGQPSSHHCRLLAHCQDELENPVYGITCTVDIFTDPNTGKTYKSASAVTNPEGDAEVTEFFAGYRTVTVSGPNIETITFPATVFEHGRLTSKIYTVRPKFQNVPAPQESKKKQSA